MRKASIAFLALGAGLVVSCANAQTYVSLGYGGLLCSNWNERKPIEGKAYEAWMLGYISSYNAYVFKGPNVIAGSDVDDLRNWVSGYCKQHPNENFDSVVRLIIDEHANRNSN